MLKLEQINLFNSDATEIYMSKKLSEKKNRKKIAYDVGEKIGGARKDEARLRKEFGELKSVNSLQQLEQYSPVLASELIEKNGLFQSFSLESEKEKGVDPVVARTKQLIIQRIDKTPSEDTAAGREAYFLATIQLQKLLDPISSMDELIAFVYSIRSKLHYEKETFEYVQERLNYAKKQLSMLSENDRNYEVAKSDLIGYEMFEASVIEAKKIPLRCLGKKFNNFFLNHRSANSTINNVQSKVDSWDDLLAQKGTKSIKATRKPPVWERSLPDRLDRKGGRKTSVNGPEKLMNTFNFRAIEFGNYLTDEIGMNHIFRCSEAYLDLSDTLNMKSDYSISLNGTLAMAFGSRGRGNAIGHHEAKAHVINLTRDRGLGGITAHEWFHSLDCYLFNESHSHKNGKLNYLSNLMDVGLGISPSIVESMKNIMNSILNGNGIVYFENTNDQDTSWRISYQTVDRYHQGNGDLLKLMMQKDSELKQAMIRRLSIIPTNQNIEKVREKAKKTYEKQMKKYGQAMAWLHFRETGERVECIPYPSHKSDFYLSAIELDRGKVGKYFSKPIELAARAFESYIFDKLDSAGRKNDYLVCGADHNKAFPTGTHRETIHQHFDEFFSLLREENLL